MSQSNSEIMVKKEYDSNNKIYKVFKMQNSIIVDTVKIYNKRGKLIAGRSYSSSSYPREVYFFKKFNNGASRLVKGCMHQLNDSTYYKTGIWTWYRKNGSTFDSIIYDHGNIVLRAHFNRKGTPNIYRYYKQEDVQYEIYKD